MRSFSYSDKVQFDAQKAAFFGEKQAKIAGVCLLMSTYGELPNKLSKRHLDSIYGFRIDGFWVEGWGVGVSCPDWAPI